jgi:hypothetical protein
MGEAGAKAAGYSTISPLYPLHRAGADAEASGNPVHSHVASRERGAALYLNVRVRRQVNRASSRWTCTACHAPCPRGVGIPDRFNSSAMPRSDVTPDACSSAMMGASSTARALARAIRAALAVRVA